MLSVIEDLQIISHMDHQLLHLFHVYMTCVSMPVHSQVHPTM